MIAKEKRQRISITMVIDGLREECDLVADAKNQYLNVVEERNRMMVELKAARVPASTLVEITGLSMSAVAKITAGARRSSAFRDLETRYAPQPRPPRL
jgi:hypothetical protein